MAEKRRELDVWIVQTNTVYRKVPYTVVTDWIQEGRLLPEDRVRAAGGEKWHTIEKVPALAAFLPRPEPFAIEDKAEALEPVTVGLDWHKGRRPDEEEDVDMIPLIDISLVLLIFFMMTAAVSSGILSPINTPPARRQLEVISQDMLWVGIDRRNPTGKVEVGTDGQPIPWYSLGKGDRFLLEPVQDLALVAKELSKYLAEEQGEVRIRLRADRDLLVEVVRRVTTELQKVGAQVNRQRGGRAPVTLRILGEVSEPKTR
jgi:biopolymer transport protein ExbD